VSVGYSSITSFVFDDRKHVGHGNLAFDHALQRVDANHHIGERHHRESLRLRAFVTFWRRVLFSPGKTSRLDA
jgi:hypothetical protein